MWEAIAVCQSLPGPLAIQVGIYISYLRDGELDQIRLHPARFDHEPRGPYAPHRNFIFAGLASVRPQSDIAAAEICSLPARRQAQELRSSRIVGEIARGWRSNFPSFWITLGGSIMAAVETRRF
jgi:hypothetical protein